MKNKNTHRSFYTAAVFTAGLMFSHIAGAGLINGDFSSGFTGWQGEVTEDDGNGGTNTVSVNPLPGSYTDNYSTATGSAVLTAASTATDPVFGVALFQDFTIDTIAAGSTLELSLDISASLTDPNGQVGFGDFITAQLESTGMTTLDLSTGGVFDVTDWAGLAASITFYIEDGDYDTDTLTIDNIAFTEKTAAVPAPATILLFTLGLAAMRKKLSAK